jgi:hypothetical protein
MINKYITFTSIYINDDKITNVIKEKIELEKDNVITRAELVDIIKKYSFFLEKRYTILSILKYNITGLKYEELPVVKLSESDDDAGSGSWSGSEEESEEEKSELEEDPNFLTIIKNIDDICLENTASSFQDLNEIIILFNEKNNIADINTNKKPSFSQTKRVYMNKKHNYRRTHRHRNIK